MQTRPSSDDHTLVNSRSTSGSQSHRHLHSDDADITQPISFLYPTRTCFHNHDPLTPDTTWSSRASRKSRSPRKTQSVVSHSHPSSVAEALEARTQSSPFKPHLEADCSFLVAIAFVIGSTAWIANGFVLLLPLYDTAYAQNNVIPGALAFVGGTAFEIGSWLMLVEAFNTSHEQMFQGPLSKLVQWEESRAPDKMEKGADSHAAKSEGAQPKFKWWGPPKWRDIGYLASLIQLFAASVFWISTLTGLPGVIPELATSPPVAIADVFYWTPQVIGGAGFVIASALLMIENQSKWYVPNVWNIGWQVGLWNLIGAVGFALCGGFGYLSLDEPWQEYQSVLSTFWGSWAFMIGSLFQLYETLWREPEEENQGQQAEKGSGNQTN